MTDTPAPPTVTGTPDGATHRVDVVTDTNPAHPFAIVYFVADDDGHAGDLAIAAVVKVGGPSDRYGRLYSHLIGNQASYVDTVSVDDAGFDVIDQREGLAEVVDVAWRVGDTTGSRTVRVTMALDFADRDGRAVIADHRGEIGSVDREVFLRLIAREFGVVIVPAAERTEIGADGCGCPITVEVYAVFGTEIDGTDRTEHREGCWAADLHGDPVRATDAEISYPLGHRYVGNMDVADRGPYTPPRYAVLGDVEQTEVGNIALRVGLTHSAVDPRWSQVLHLVLTPAERDQLRHDLDRFASGTNPSWDRSAATRRAIDVTEQRAAATAPGDGRSETETDYVRVVDGTTFRMDKASGTVGIDHPAVEAVLANLRAAAEPVYDRTDPVQVMAARRYAWELDKQVNAGDQAAIARTAHIEALRT